MTREEKIALLRQKDSGAPVMSREEKIAKLRSTGPAPTAPTARIKTREPVLKQVVGYKEGETPDMAITDFGEGIVSSGLSTVAGLADLVGYEGLNETAADWKADAGESGWGTAGEVVGELAQFALPAGAALKAVKGGSRLAKAYQALGKGGKVAAGVGGEALMGGAMGGVQLPQEGDSRLRNMAEGTALGAVGGVGGRVLGKAIKGAAKSASGEALETGIKRAGGDLPPIDLSAGQVSTGVPQAVEELMSYLPVTAQPVKNLRAKGATGFVNRMINLASPDDAKVIEGFGPKAMSQLKTNIKTGYDNAWKEADTVVTDDTRKALNKIMNKAKPVINKDKHTFITKIKREINHQMNKTKMADGKYSYRSNKDAAKAIDKKISKEIKKAGDDGDVVDMLKSVRRELRSEIGAGAEDALKTMDGNYTKYLAVTAAADDATKVGLAGNFTGEMLGTRINQYGGFGAGARGETPLFKEMRQGIETIYKEKTGGVLDKFKRVMQMIPFPAAQPITKTMLNSTIGETAAQKLLKKAAEKRIPIIGTPIGNVLRMLPATAND